MARRKQHKQNQYIFLKPGENRQYNILLSGVMGLDVKPFVARALHISRARPKPHRHMKVVFFSLLAAFSLSGLFACRRTTADHLDFNQDVQPILASRCFSCHGPDPEMRKAGLRLDLAEWAMRKRPQRPDAIVPGHPEKSELVKRIESKDPHYLMPQAAQGEAKSMSRGEIATLREWIREGAVYRPHWAFEVPRRPAVPVTPTRAVWAKTPIDHFILAKLEQAGLEPSPEAERAALIRRVALDLTGLLPTPDEVNRFIKDRSPDAYEHLVDGLLTRP